MKTNLIQISKPVKWGISLVTNIQKLVSISLATITALTFVASVIVYFVKFITFDDITLAIVTTFMMFLYGWLVMMFIKNIRKPTTITLIIEAIVVTFCWACVSFGSYLGELYINHEDPYVNLTEHAFKAASPESLGQTLLTGFNLGLPGILIITLFYAAQIVVRRYIALLSSKQLGV